MRLLHTVTVPVSNAASKHTAWGQYRQTSRQTTFRTLQVQICNCNLPIFPTYLSGPRSRLPTEFREVPFHKKKKEPGKTRGQILIHQTHIDPSTGQATAISLFVNPIHSRGPWK